MRIAADVVLKNRPRLSQDEENKLMDEYMRLFPESREWDMRRWDDMLLDNLKKTCQDILGEVTHKKNLVDYKNVAMELLQTDESETNLTKLKAKDLQKIRTSKRLTLSHNPNHLLHCLQLDDENNDPFVIERENVVLNDDPNDFIIGLPPQVTWSVRVSTTMDPLSSAVIVPSRLREAVLAQEAKRPILNMYDPLSFRRAFGRVYDFDDTLGEHDITVSIGTFIILGGKTIGDVLSVDIRTCSVMPTIAAIDITYLGTQEGLNRLYYWVMDRFQARVTQDRVAALSRGMEIPLERGIVVRIEKLSTHGGREIFAGTFLFGENPLKYTLYPE